VAGNSLFSAANLRQTGGDADAVIRLVLICCIMGLKTRFMRQKEAVLYRLHRLLRLY